MIRPMTQNDKNEFLEMAQAFYSSSAVDHPIAKEILEANFSEAVSDSDFVKGYIVEEDGSIAGFAIISFSYAGEVGGLCVWLEEIFIKDEFRGSGLGGAFLDFIKQEFGKKAKRFRLEITSANKGAKKLYLRNGFEMLAYEQMVYDPKA